MIRKSDPKADPGYKRSIEHVKKFGNEMVFSSDGERRDYEAGVRANPNNILGMPCFYPPVKLQASFSDLHASRECATEKCGGCCIERDHWVCRRCKRSNA